MPVRLRVTAIVLIALLGFVAGRQQTYGEELQGFPHKPIKVIVYTKPGGSIDLTARRFVEIAQRYSDEATFVVENKSGAGGIVALKKVLRMRPDGHTLCAVTKSNIAKIIASGRMGYLDDLDWLAQLLVDPECVIVHNETEIDDWQKLVADLRSKQGRQVWAGPASGGLDHVVAMRIWDQLGVGATWVPHASGGKAISALISGVGVAYVGNPADAKGNPTLTIAAVSSPSRLKEFPDVPTLREFGVNDLDELNMWRGFAIKKGCPPEVRRWYSELFEKVTQDPEWRAFWEPDGIQVVHRDPDEFRAIVRQDAEEFEHYLGQLQMLPDASSNSTVGLKWLLGSLFAIAAFASALAFAGRWSDYGYVVVPGAVTVLAIQLLAETASFPTTDGVGAAVIPRLWGVVLIALAGVAALTHKPVTPDNSETIDASKPRLDFVALLTVALMLYVVANEYIGYFISTFVFLFVLTYVLGERRWWLITTVSLGWIIGAYVIFQKILYVPLPIGRVWE